MGMRLVNFPYVMVRLRCDVCKRAGSYRLARLTAKYGPEIDLDDLLDHMSQDCPWRNDRKPLWKSACGIKFTDRDIRGLTLDVEQMLARHQPVHTGIGLLMAADGRRLAPRRIPRRVAPREVQLHAAVSDEIRRLQAHRPKAEREAPVSAILSGGRRPQRTG